MSEFLPRRRLPPLKQQALEDLALAPITGVFNGGWTGRKGNYHTHTILWLTEVGWATFDAARTEATITRAGRNYLKDLAEGWVDG